MSTRLYPLFKKGNPQLRIFLPNFWMKIIKPKEPIPPYMVTFHTSLEMTEYDVKNYLEKIYKIPVVEVKLTIKQGLIRKAYGAKYLVKEDDFKEALVTLPRNYTFTYPELLGNVKAKNENIKKELKELENTVKKSQNHGVPSWFS